MTESFIDDLALIVSHKIGRKVTIGRYRDRDFSIRGAGGRPLKVKEGAWRYNLGFEGCTPSHFGPMNINEAKRFLAALSDMFSSKIIRGADDDRGNHSADTQRAGDQSGRLVQEKQAQDDVY